MELIEKLKLVEHTLSLQLIRDIKEYKSTYLIIFGKEFKYSCDCQLHRIRIDLLNWYNENSKLINN